MPLLSSADTPLSPSLTVEIHAATRHSHTELNQLITARLPLCLPPQVNNAELYTLGFTAFGQIYIAFEGILARLLAKGEVDEQTLQALSRVSLPRLARSARIQADLRLLRTKSTEQVLASSDEMVESGMAWRERIETSVQSGPHRVLAYQWVMYMALFNGGRWIRSQLVSAGADFWRETSRSDKAGSQDCLSFWDFEGEDDGEELKVDFRSRFSQVASQLSDQQRQDIVEEAVKIFQLCHEIVNALDQQAASTLKSEKVAQADSEHGPKLQQYSLFAFLSSVWWAVSVAFVPWKRPGYAPGLDMNLRAE